MPFFGQLMNQLVRKIIRLVALALVAATPFSSFAGKSYSSGGGHSYSSGSQSSGGSSHSTSTHTSSSSHSSGGGSAGRSSSGGSSESFTSGSGKSYSSHSTQSDERTGYSSGKSYSASKEAKSTSIPASEKTARTYRSGSGKDYSSGTSPTASGTKRAEPAPNSLSFDTAAARARKEEASKQDFNRYKEERQTANTRPVPSPAASSPTYTGPPPPIQTTRIVSTTVSIPDTYTIRTRSSRWGSVFTPY